jgi:glycerol uptake facilitator-like aquaporin
LTFYQAILAEFIGVYILTMVVCGLGLSFSKTEQTPSINGAIGGGLTLATMIWATNCISGANLNPAITIVLVVTKSLDPLRGFFYIVVQLAGAVAGSATLHGLVPANLRPAMLGVTQINDKIGLLKGFGIETIITFLLAFTIFACLDKNRKDLGGSFPLAIGLSVTAGALFGVKIRKIESLLKILYLERNLNT